MALRDAVQGHWLVLASFLWCGLVVLIAVPLSSVLTSLLGQLYANILWFSATCLCCCLCLW